MTWGDASFLDWLAAGPFLASLLFCGMPHGAADGWLAWRVARAEVSAAPARRAAWHRVTLMMAIYTAAVGLAAGLLCALPGWTLAAFLVIAVVHFGLASTRLHAWESRATGQATAAALVLLPFVFRLDETQALFSLAAQELGGEGFPRGAAVGLAAAGLAGAGLGGVCRAALLCRAGSRAAVRRHAIGLSAILGFALSAWLLPPLAAVGLGFLAYHAVPESLRIGGMITRGGPAWRLLASHAASLPLQIPTVAAVVAAGVWLDVPVSPEPLAMLVIISYAVVTPGHLVFQEWADARLARLARRAAPAVGVGGGDGSVGRASGASGGLDGLIRARSRARPPAAEAVRPGRMTPDSPGACRVGVPAGRE